MSSTKDNPGIKAICDILDRRHIAYDIEDFNDPKDPYTEEALYVACHEWGGTQTFIPLGDKVCYNSSSCFRTMDPEIAVARVFGPEELTHPDDEFRFKAYVEKEKLRRDLIKLIYEIKNLANMIDHLESTL